MSESRSRPNVRSVSFDSDNLRKLDQARGEIKRSAAINLILNSLSKDQLEKLL